MPSDQAAPASTTPDTGDERLAGRRRLRARSRLPRNRSPPPIHTAASPSPAREVACTGCLLSRQRVPRTWCSGWSRSPTSTTAPGAPARKVVARRPASLRPPRRRVRHPDGRVPRPRCDPRARIVPPEPLLPRERRRRRHAPSRRASPGWQRRCERSPPAHPVASRCRRPAGMDRRPAGGAGPPRRAPTGRQLRRARSPTTSSAHSSSLRARPDRGSPAAGEIDNGEREAVELPAGPGVADIRACQRAQVDGSKNPGSSAWNTDGATAVEAATPRQPRPAGAASTPRWCAADPKRAMGGKPGRTSSACSRGASHRDPATRPRRGRRGQRERRAQVRTIRRRRRCPAPVCRRSMRRAIRAMVPASGRQRGRAPPPHARELAMRRIGQSGQVPEPRPATGLIIGRFDPPHLGHSFLVEEAARRCERLVVYVNSSAARDAARATPALTVAGRAAPRRHRRRGGPRPAHRLG